MQIDKPGNRKNIAYSESYINILSVFAYGGISKRNLEDSNFCKSLQNELWHKDIKHINVKQTEISPKSVSYTTFFFFGHLFTVNSDIITFNLSVSLAWNLVEFYIRNCFIGGFVTWISLKEKGSRLIK